MSCCQLPSSVAKQVRACQTTAGLDPTLLSPHLYCQHFSLHLWKKICKWVDLFLNFLMCTNKWHPNLPFISKKLSIYGHIVAIGFEQTVSCSVSLITQVWSVKVKLRKGQLFWIIAVKYQVCLATQSPTAEVATGKINIVFLKNYFVIECFWS
jgi:hypothetical protein